MSNQEKIKQAKNGRVARKINKLFGTRAYTTEDGKMLDQRFFDEMKLPVFYGSASEIPSQETGAFFVWDKAQIWYIDYSLRCIRTKIEKLFQGNENRYVFSVAAFSHGDGPLAKAFCRFLMEAFRPVAQYKEPKEKVYDWELIARRFWAKTKIFPGKGTAPDDCDASNHAIWTGAKSNGYGVFSLRGKTTTAHRVAYILARGEIPDGAQVRKMCESKLCCNPMHLKLIVPGEQPERYGVRRRTAGEIGIERTRDRQELDRLLAGRE